MRIKKEETVALFVDLQERLLPVIDQREEIVKRNVMLSEGLKILGVSRVFLHQYPKGLGEIAPEIKETAGDCVPFDKSSFSAMGDDAIAAEFERLRVGGVKNVIVTGVEAHICVLQSCIDLVAAGFQPVLVTDCIGSRTSLDKEIGIHRAVQESVLLTTAEAILFELCVEAGTDQFKAISKLIK
ncbi:MAG: isochorismatase family protein [Oscillospiraceae bacterium]|nr:isochorismatase family protein [Oscillospiraceae bacterium]